MSEFRDMNKKIFSYADVHFESWYWVNSTGDPDDNGVTHGIGGSETQQTEVAWRLQQRGWDVTVYAPVPWEGVREWRGTKWTHYRNADFSQAGIWMLYRNPTTIDRFDYLHPKQNIILIAQDEDYSTWTDERMAKVDSFQAICQTHAQHMALRHPQLKDKIFVIPNGVKVDLIREIEAEQAALPPDQRIVRNPHRLIWSSSPDRGLEPLLKIFNRAREWVSDLELVITYGFDNMDKLIAMDPSFGKWRGLKDRIVALAQQPGVIMKGRLSQQELYREKLGAGIMAHPSLFPETGFISLCEGQALGNIPITNPIWAAGEYTLHGCLIEGNPYTDELVQLRYVDAIRRIASRPDLQDQMRPQMMYDARATFSWDRIVDDFEAKFLGFIDHRFHRHQFTFQLKHSQGDILNCGCADDPADLKGLGATNLDLRSEDPIFHRPTKADILADVRDLPLNGHRFDTVVYGDILEHFDPAEVSSIIAKGRKCLKPGGRIVITIPNDHRPADRQHAGSDGTEEYAAGVSACHTHRVPLEMLHGWVEEAGMRVETSYSIEYDSFTGWGLVAATPAPGPPDTPPSPRKHKPYSRPRNSPTSATGS